ncbi:MAG: DUF5682 family protein [Zoogloeaceae bacterium]|jgi:hypothetical protein|nr:DUF5682 family protein [Zoogloeaceae bacterium]
MRADAGVHFFGIRHHGPGSAACLVQALEALQPAAVLIEGPADATPILPMLAAPGMKPPVALLCYPKDDPARAGFWPFAEFSPEYQAVLWAVAHAVPVSFIDLPSTARQPEKKAEAAAGKESEAEDGAEGAAENEAENPHAQHEEAPPREYLDPLGVLAEAAGYQDGESWWSDLIEHNPAPGPVFEAIAEAMAALRENLAETPEFEALREAHMRRAIAAARKEQEGPLAVVCGAWHVPALAAASAATRKADQARLKGLPREKSAVTWAPWTSPRLARDGYGAGVAAPGWNLHLWRGAGARQDGNSLWLVRIAHVLREQGYLVSTASLIEAERLAQALAAIRERPRAGFEELREAAIACLFGGESLLWERIEATLLLGNDVGEIPPDVPLAPLIEDLQRQQKATRLKAEALPQELSLDLRSESGLARSTLLHRLDLLGVPWGRAQDAGGSRGTFRERWQLAWEPEFAVRLVEHLVHGPTIAQAAAGCLLEQIRAATTLDQMAESIRAAITANLPEAAAEGLRLFEARAAHSDNCPEMLASIPPLADIIRYGEARATAAAQHLAPLLERLIVEAALKLDYAARSLDAEAAAQLAAQIDAAHTGIRLIEAGEEILAAWMQGLAAVLDDEQGTPSLAGTAARLLYGAGRLAPEAAVTLMGRRLSPGVPVADAASFLEGFFHATATLLIHDAALRQAVDLWITHLEEADFITSLPLLRRVFSALDQSERKRLLAAALGQSAAVSSLLRPAPDGGAGWQAHFAMLATLLAEEHARKNDE